MKKIYAIYDAKAAAYLTPIFFDTEGIAVRQFTAAVKDPDHELHKFAEDYTLFHIGEFDEHDAKFELLDTPEPVVKALSVKEA